MLQHLFLFIATLLGARVFKHYWPTGGSYWNKYHIDKKSKCDLIHVIEQADEYTHQHMAQMVAVLTMLSLCHLAGEVPYFWNYMFATSVYHAYAFMIHHYNRILARRALLKLPEDTNDISNSSPKALRIVPDFEMHIIKQYDCAYFVCVYIYGVPITSKIIFKKETTAILYKEYLMDHFDLTTPPDDKLIMRFQIELLSPGGEYRLAKQFVIDKLDFEPTDFSPEQYTKICSVEETSN